MTAAAGLFALACLFPQAEFVARQLPRLRHVSDARWLHAAVILFRLLLAVDAALLLWWAHRSVVHRVAGAAPKGSPGIRQIGASQSLQPRPPIPGTLAGRKELLPLLVVLALSAVLRFARLDTDLWLDEIGTVINFAHSDLATTLTAYPSANHHPLNSLLVRLSVLAFGESNWSVRFPAALLGIGGIAGMYVLARTVTTASEALLTTVLLACSYHHVFYSQSARGYAGYLLGTMLGTAFFLRLLTSHRRADAAGYVASMLLAFCCHPNTLFVAAAHALVLLLVVIARDRAERHRISAGWGVFGAFVLVGLFTFHFYALMLPDMIGYFRGVETTGIGYAPLSSLFWNAFARGMQLGAPGLVVVIAMLGIVAAGSISYLRQNPFVALACILPLKLGLIIALALHAPIYPRYFLFGLPIGLLLAVRGISVVSELTGSWTADALRRGLWTSRTGTALFAASLLAVSLPLVRYYTTPRQPYTAALRFAAEDGPGHIVAIDLAIPGCRYYQPGVNSARSVAELRDIEAGHPDVRVLYTFPSSLRARRPELLRYLETNYRTVKTLPAVIGDGEIRVCRPRIEPHRIAAAPSLEGTE